MPAISKTKGLDVYNDTNTTMTFNGRSFPKRNGIDVQLYDYIGGNHQKWLFISTSNAVTGVHMSNLDGSSAYFFNAAEDLHDSLSSVVPCAKLTDSSATDVWKLMQSSGIFFFNGHGAPTFIICGGESSTLTRDYVLSQPAGSLSNCKLVVYNSCETAAGGVGAENLAQATISRGATTVVGFKQKVSVNQSDTWMTAFCQALAGGRSVNEAISDAYNAVHGKYGDDHMGNVGSVEVFGQGGQRLK